MALSLGMSAAASTPAFAEAEWQSPKSTVAPGQHTASEAEWQSVPADVLSTTQEAEWQ